MALIAALIIPNRKAMEKGEIPKYTSSKSNAVYALGAIVLFMTLIYIAYISLNVGDILLGLINSIIFIVVGIGILTTNRSLVNLMKDREMGTQAFGAPVYGSDVDVDVMTGTPAGPGARYPAQPEAVSGPQQPSGEGINVQVRLPITPGDKPDARPVQPPSAARSTMKLACPKCQGVIVVDRNSKSGPIQCSHCGFTGRVG